VNVDLVVVWAIDLGRHFVTSGLAACGASTLMRHVLYLLFSQVGGRRGVTTLEEQIISLFCLSVVLCASSWAHCLQDFGREGLCLLLEETIKW
jgi:hypothetical protein